MRIDGVLVQWGERLFYPGNRIVRSASAPKLSGGMSRRAAAIRGRIRAAVRRAPQVMVKVTGGGRGMAAIRAHLRYISRNGELEVEDDRGITREGKEALHDLAEQWQHGGSFIDETSHRREAFNIILSMPRGTDPLMVQRAAREFALAELKGHRYVMVLHDDQANPHVHISVRAESRDGERLNPRKPDLQRWRKTFAERLRGCGVDAEATRQAARGQVRNYAPIWRVKAAEEGRLKTQGAIPPGSGKTYRGARMIACLLAMRCRVGIMSNSHKAINHMLANVMGVVAEQGLDVKAVKKCTAGRPDTKFDGPGSAVENLDSNDKVWESGAQLVAGTVWLFSRPEADQEFDALFVDEAGQVALANLVAAGTCARNIVLLGDQMQLSQPVQGVHPGRSGDSALDYLLDGAATIAPDRGIFLATSFRMHPFLCRFISDAVYDGRLEPEAGNVRRALLLDDTAHLLLRPAGIVHAPIEHRGCSQRSDAEASLVREIYDSALRQRYTDKEGREHSMSPANILVVAPYNVQVNALKRALPESARVGTVDKFQGQEAELVIVSMTTSSEQDLPRVGADSNLSHRADPILSQGWKPTLRGVGCG